MRPWANVIIICLLAASLMGAWPTSGKKYTPGGGGSWVLTDLGSATNTSGGTIGLTGLSIPPGALIIVGVSDNSHASSGGSLADSASDSYTSIIASANGASSNGFGQVFYFNNNATTVTSITYTKQTSGSSAVIAAMYAAGGGILDSAVTNSASGTAGGPSITSGAPSTGSELLVAWLTWPRVGGVGNPSLTQDTAHGWTSIGGLDFAFAGTAPDAVGGGGNQVTGAATVWAPTAAKLTDWAAFTVGFKP
jgi:hypothetical protein